MILFRIVCSISFSSRAGPFPFSEWSDFLGFPLFPLGSLRGLPGFGVLAEGVACEDGFGLPSTLHRFGLGLLKFSSFLLFLSSISSDSVNTIIVHGLHMSFVMDFPAFRG